MSIHQTILGKVNSKNVVLIFNLTSAEVILQIQSEICWAHSSILVSFLCQSSLSQWEFLNIFYIFVILRYDIYDKFQNLVILVTFIFGLFWPLLEAIEKLFCWCSLSNGCLGVLKVSWRVTSLDEMNFKFLSVYK